MEGAKDGSAVQLGKHESAVAQIVAKESNSYEAASSSQNGTSTKATSKTADASKTTEDKVPDTLRQALRKLVLLSQNAISDAPKHKTVAVVVGVATAVVAIAIARRSLFVVGCCLLALRIWSLVYLVYLVGWLVIWWLVWFWWLVGLFVCWLGWVGLVGWLVPLLVVVGVVVAVWWFGGLLVCWFVGLLSDFVFICRHAVSCSLSGVRYLPKAWEDARLKGLDMSIHQAALHATCKSTFGSHWHPRSWRAICKKCICPLSHERS